MQLFLNRFRIQLFLVRLVNMQVPWLGLVFNFSIPLITKYRFSDNIDTISAIVPTATRSIYSKGSNDLSKVSNSA